MPGNMQFPGQHHHDKENAFYTPTAPTSLNSPAPAPSISDELKELIDQRIAEGIAQGLKLASASTPGTAPPLPTTSVTPNGRGQRCQAMIVSVERLALLNQHLTHYTTQDLVHLVMLTSVGIEAVAVRSGQFTLPTPLKPGEEPRFSAEPNSVRLWNPPWLESVDKPINNAYITHVVNVILTNKRVRRR
jgi:hypothetical protein